MLGESTFQPYAINTFSHRGRKFTEITPAHYVHPHEVSSYRRKDGTFVRGYWRDGDGDNSVDRASGYFVRNPGAVSRIVKGWVT